MRIYSQIVKSYVHTGQRVRSYAEFSAVYRTLERQGAAEKDSAAAGISRQTRPASQPPQSWV